jgi:hypothetical protein
LVGAPRFELGTSCAQGRRATRLRYAPTVTALCILKHFPTLLLIRSIAFTLVKGTFRGRQFHDAQFCWTVEASETPRPTLNTKDGVPSSSLYVEKARRNGILAPCLRRRELSFKAGPPAKFHYP